jgi:hypothetical protein
MANYTLIISSIHPLFRDPGGSNFSYGTFVLSFRRFGGGFDCKRRVGRANVIAISGGCGLTGR